jgi:hypothetical protein
MEKETIGFTPVVILLAIGMKEAVFFLSISKMVSLNLFGLADDSQKPSIRHKPFFAEGYTVAYLFGLTHFYFCGFINPIHFYQNLNLFSMEIIKNTIGGTTTPLLCSVFNAENP